MVKFEIGKAWAEERNYINYRKDEYSFDTLSPLESNSPLLINDLNLVISRDNRLLGVYGFCPYTSWKASCLGVPESRKHDLFVEESDLLESGVSYRINESEWTVHFDENLSFVCVGCPESEGTAIEFASGAILVLSPKKEALSLWIRL